MVNHPVEERNCSTMRVLTAFRKRWLPAAAVVISTISLAAAPHTSPVSSARPTSARSTGTTEAPPEVPPPDMQIGDIRFRVDLQPFSDTYVGMTHFSTHTVQIDPSSQADERRRVYLHELMHVAWHNGAASPDKSRKYTEEEAIQALTPGLLKMLAENPQAVEYLTKPAK